MVIGKTVPSRGINVQCVKLFTIKIMIEDGALEGQLSMKIMCLARSKDLKQGNDLTMVASFVPHLTLALVKQLIAPLFPQF